MSFGWFLKRPCSGAGYFIDRDFTLSPTEQGVYDALESDFRELSRTREFPSRQDAAACMAALLKRHCEKLHLLLPRSRGQVITAAAELNLLGLGPLDLILADESIEEVAVVGAGRPVFAYVRGRGWLSTNCFITSEEFAAELANRMAKPLGRRLTLHSPRLNAPLATGDRLHASMPPVSVNGVELTIRKFRSQPFSLAELAGAGALPFPAAAALSLAAFADVNIAVVGNTGSGKTTLLNSLFSFIPLSERVVVTEETPELRLPQEHAVRMVSNRELGVSLQDLVEDTLRMRPDRVVVGEVRSAGEARALFDALLAGQARGTLFTMHGRSAGEALSRLSSLGASSDELAAIDLVVAVRRAQVLSPSGPVESRRLTELMVNRPGRPKLFGPTSPGLSAAVFDLVEKNYGLGRGEFKRELSLREAFMRNNATLPFGEFTALFQQNFLAGDTAQQPFLDGDAHD